MARARVLELGALNLTVHPHSDEIYLDLLTQARTRQLVAPMRGNRFALIGYVRPSLYDVEGTAVEGQLFSFVDFDRNAAWYDTKTGEQAEESALEEVHIPETLKPDLRRFNFLFFPENHRLVIETYSHESHRMSPGAARHAFDTLLNDPSLVSQFGKVEVVVEPEKDALKKILKMPFLNRLKILVTRPNADTTEEVEEEVFRRLEEQRSDQLVEEYRAQDGASLKPNKRTRSLARVAASNGYVEGHGKKENGEPAHVYTQEHPMSERISYDPETQPAAAALADAAGSILRKILGRP